MKQLFRKMKLIGKYVLLMVKMALVNDIHELNRIDERLRVIEDDFNSKHKISKS
jgi:hypothetical protein